MASLILLGSTSCLRSSRKPKSSANGTNTASDFRVTEITGNSISDSSNESWSVPTGKEYEFSVCLIGRNTNAQLPAGQKFRVKLYGSEIKDVTTDDLGCLEWSENVPFNFSGDSGYIGLNRKLSGMGTYQGSVELKIGVNPWSEYRAEGTTEVIDLNRNKIAANSMLPEAASQGGLIGLFSDNSGRDLMIDSQVPLNIISTKRVADGRIIKMTIQAKPYILPLDINGDQKKYNFKNGEFRVHALLVGNYVGIGNAHHTILTHELMPQEVKLTNGGTLSFSVDTKLNRRINNGQVQLALRIEPLNAPFRMNNYEGLHDLGTFDEILGQKSAPQIKGTYTNELFDYGAFVETTTNFQDLVDSGFAQDLPPIYFSYLEPRFVRFQPGETVTRRKLKYQVSTRVTDSITGKPVQFQPFHIKKAFDGSIITDQITNQDGVIRWMDDIEHLYYRPEQYFYPQSEITHIESGFIEKRTLAINPWDEGWTFGVDISGQEAEHRQVNQREGRPPLFIVDAFRYQTIRFQYGIDEFMTLNVKKAVVMTFDPVVQRFGIKGDRYHEPLRDGIYLMKVALIKYYLDPFKAGTHLYNKNHTEDPDDEEAEPNYVLKPSQEGAVYEEEDYRKGRYSSIIKKLVRVQGGRITTPIEFSMRDLRMMSIRTNLLVQIETIDEEKLLRDNIIDDKILQLKEDYIAYNSSGLSATEKALFIETKEALFKKEVADLQSTMREEIGAVRQQREFVSDQYFKRFEVLSELEDSLGSAAAAGTSRYQENLELPEREFNNLVERLHENTNSLELSMGEYWKEWEEAYKKSLIEGTTETGLPAIPKENIEAKKSYYDYLATMNTFLTDFGVGATVGQSDLNRMKVNNYTENPAAPFIDLNLYRNESGLKTRAFIAPCTLVEDDNMSDMRATDVLDEDRSGRIDSSEQLYTPRYVIDNSAFEDSAYHDSLKPFKDDLVDDYIQEHIANEDHYVMEMDAISQMGNFTRLYNLDFVSLKNNVLQEYEEGCKFIDGQICTKPRLKDQVWKEDFLTKFNSVDMRHLLKRYFYNNSEESLVEIDERLQGSDYKVKELWEVAVEETKNFFDFLSFQPLWGGADTTYERSAIKYAEEKLNDTFEETTELDLKSWLKTGVKGIDLSSALKVCKYLSEKAIARLVEQDMIDPKVTSGGAYRLTPGKYLLDHCLQGIKYIPSSGDVHLTSLSFDRRYRIITPGAYRHISGKNMNINVGSETVIANYKDTGTATSFGSNAAFIGLMAAGISKANPLVSAVVGAVGGFLAVAKSATKAYGVNEATASAISAATFLVVQKAEMEFTIETHEKCLISQFNSKFISTINWRYMGLKEGLLTNDKNLTNTIGRGFMICDGERHETPEKVTENFYYFTQHFTAGDMLDQANLLNHVWLLALRGSPDYNNFIRILQAQKINSENEIVGTTEDLYEYQYPLSHLDEVYQNVTPTFPGMYSVPHSYQMEE